MFKIIKENEILIVPIKQSLTQKVLLKKSSGENCFKNIKYYLSWNVFIDIGTNVHVLMYECMNIMKMI
jgi:hypothetical protein